MKLCFQGVIGQLDLIPVAGKGGLELVAVVVLESDGNISVIPSSQLGSGSAIAD